MDLKKEMNYFYNAHVDGYNHAHNTWQNTLSIFGPRIKLHKIAVFERYFVCGICYSIFPSFHDQYTHKILHECNTTGTSSDMKTHKVKYSGGKPFKCDVCRYAGSTSRNLNHHKLRHTGGKPFKCDECSYATVYLRSSKMHKMRHSGEKPYKCDDCCYASSTSWNLNSHKLKHTGRKPFKCDVCSYATAYSKSLRVHKMRHSGEKPFKCDECSYAASYSESLKRHKMRHAGEKPYRCDVCSYAGSTSGSLSSHKLKHTVKKPFKCDECSYTCSTSGDLNSHKLRHTNMTFDLRSRKGEITESILPIKSEPPVVEESSYSEEDASQQAAEYIDGCETASLSIPYVPRSQLTYSEIQIDHMDLKKELNDFYNVHMEL